MTPGPQNKEKIPKTHSWPNPKIQGNCNPTSHAYQDRPPAQRPPLEIPLHQSTRFPLNPHSKPFTSASVAPSEEASESKAATKDVLHSPYKQDNMHIISLTNKPRASTPDSLSRRTASPLSPITLAPPTDIPNIADDQGMTATIRPRIVDAIEDLPICQPLTLAISSTIVTYAYSEVKAKIKRDAVPGSSKQYHSSSNLISRCATNGTILILPPPPQLNDAKVWQGTITQAFFKTNMRPTHSPLSNKLPLAWYPELEAAFKVSSREIIKQRELGVKSFPSLPTCLARDWNKFGTAPAMPLPCPSQRRRPQML